MKITRIVASKSNRATKSTQDMLEAFESKLAEFDIESCDRIMSSKDVTASDIVFITDSDKDIWYDDNEGLFDGKDGMVSLADLKNYWNSEKDNDPCLSYYPTFQNWLRDSVNNGYLSMIDSEAYELIGSTNIFDETTEGQLNSTEDIGMCTITSSEDVEIFEEDRHEKYQDVGGGFGGSGDEIITLADAKEYWNKNKYNDPSLSCYPSFNRWWTDTRDNFLIEAGTCVKGCDISSNRQCVNCSIELDEHEQEELFEIVDKYNTSYPVSGKWTLETMDEMQTIADYFDVTLDEARDVMIKYLGFTEDDLLFDTEGGAWFILKDLGGNSFTEHFANAEDASEFAQKYGYDLVGPADGEMF